LMKAEAAWVRRLEVRAAAVLVEATVVKMAFARAAMAAGTALAVAAGSAWTVLELSLSGSERAAG